MMNGLQVAAGPSVRDPPSTAFGLLVAILAPYVGKCVHKVTTAVAALEDVEGRLHEAEDRNVHAVTPDS